ncbi:MAG: endonuclease MutS2 [Sulfurovum sp.]|nr:endonuclease MutS2 [Sulfurovum sp.]MCB4749358.1 endonuclease MutS2 [Sulfurovum sp.]MCB4759040.1 endonuclease MutS2 [Sulfurovum sp.]MCB4762379.1 endonuclease MutS2 [Sulfurovum sp.]MCB4764349.1 endonuclease MutS2 [Sulfurovum sp.]
MPQGNQEKPIIQKLDLEGYIFQFKQFLSRDKSVAMEGDINQHFRYIKALSSVQFPVPQEIPNLDKELNLIKKQGVLALEEIYAFVVMIGYFNRLKASSLPEPVGSWIGEIEIPEAIMETLGYFTDEGKINPERDAELMSLERAIKHNKGEIKETLYRLTHSTKLRDYLVDTQVHFHSGEETLLVRGGFNHALKATVVGRSSGGFFYVIPQHISHLKEKEAALLSSRSELIWRYCKQISEIFHQWERFLSFINKAYDRFDHYQARVSFARMMEYEFILPSKGKQVILHNFIHPAIENPVPVSIDMSKPIFLITGVNAGGKTMLLKSVLSAVYMSKYLLPFKCDATRTKVGHYKSIEAVIDDPQSVKNDISTFAGRMQEFARLFTKSDAIVGVDEIELGTDSDEAASLFRVMLETLKNRGISFVVTTHHKRLASLMASSDDVELVAALYDEEQRVPTYTFLQGSIGKSYAFETAQRYGVPPAIIQEAKKVYGEDKENLNDLIERSTSLEREMRQKIGQVDHELKAIEKQKQKLLDEEASLKEQHRKTLATLENRYNAATKKAREVLKVKELGEGHRLLNEAHKRKQVKLEEAKLQETEPLKVGDNIKYRSHRGELLAIRSKDATIEVDGLKMRVPLKELKKQQEIRKPKVPQKPKKVMHYVEKSGASVSVKLLGMYADEAIETVDKFLSDALVNNLSEVQIIHGTGGGVLAKLVTDYLKQHPKIQTFYRMPGNLGITVVEL